MILEKLLLKSEAGVPKSEGKKSAMLELITTEDGSKTIYNSEVGENYHSRHGALQESQHVFLNSGLIYFLDKRESTFNENNIKVSSSGEDLEGAGVTILEVGFGTG